jgi:two-component system nitrate/nitrite response regulator NarL
MSYNVVPSEQTGVPIREELATCTNVDAAETALQGRQEPWPANGEVPTALMVANGFVRQGLKSFLKGTRFQVVTSAATLSEMDAVMDGQSTPALIIVVSDDAASADAIRALRTTYADAKLVILGRFEAPGSLPKDVCLTVQAVLDYDIGQETLIAALDVVMSGATIQSAGLLSRLMDQPKPSFGFSHQSPRSAEQGTAETQTAAGPMLCHRLTDREIKVLQVLATGVSNKLIARQYDLAEATVKIHVKNIMRKLQTPNRTQAAIWARENGICG